jgi:hypothetical protein
VEFIGNLMILAAILLAFFAVVATTGWAAPHTKWGQFCIFWLTPYGIAVRLLRQPSLQGLATETSADPAQVEFEPPDAEDKIRSARRGDFISIEGREEQVKARARLLELKFFGSDKNDKRHVDPNTGDKLREFLALRLAGKQLLIKHPCAEGGSLAFFLYEDHSDDIPKGFTEYLKGSREDPGPAKRFSDSNQQAEVTFDAAGRSWMLQDLIWVDVESEKGKFFVENSSDGKPARLVMLLGRNTADEEEWALFAEVRNGEGGNTLWIGRRFDPEIDID